MGIVYTILFFGSVLGAFFLVNQVIARFKDLQLQLRRTQKQRQDVIDFLNRFSRSLATVAEIDHAMQLVAHYLHDVLRTESIGVFAVDEADGADARQLRGAAVAGTFPVFKGLSSDIVLTREKYRLEHLRHEFIDFGEGVLGRVAESERSALIADVSASPYRDEIPAGVHTLMAVPMHVEGHLLGVICAVNSKDEGHSFDQDDLHLLETLAFQAALASNLVQIYSQRSKQERISQELQFGREIQQSLLPSSVPDWGEYRFAAYTCPALEVGGDYYDFVEIDEDRLMVVVADAAGKGVPACMLMAMCQSSVHSLVEQYAGLEPFLASLNARLFRGTDPAHFLTMAVAVIDKRTHVCEYGNAGHTALLLSRPDGTTLQVNPEGPALGLLPDDLGVQFDTLSFCFDPGMSLMLFTDGITEALNRDEEEFGLTRLHDLVEASEKHPEKLADAVVDSVGDFVGDAPQFDDQTLMVIGLPG